jgi:hypothetical protein
MLPVEVLVYACDSFLTSNPRDIVALAMSCSALWGTLTGPAADSMWRHVYRATGMAVGAPDPPTPVYAAVAEACARQYIIWTDGYMRCFLFGRTRSGHASTCTSGGGGGGGPKRGPCCITAEDVSFNEAVLGDALGDATSGSRGGASRMLFPEDEEGEDEMDEETNGGGGEDYTIRRLSEGAIWHEARLRGIFAQGFDVPEEDEERGAESRPPTPTTTTSTTSTTSPDSFALVRTPPSTPLSSPPRVPGAPLRMGAGRRANASPLSQARRSIRSMIRSSVDLWATSTMARSIVNQTARPVMAVGPLGFRFNHRGVLGTIYRATFSYTHLTSPATRVAVDSVPCGCFIFNPRSGEVEHDCGSRLMLSRRSDAAIDRFPYLYMALLACNLLNAMLGVRIQRCIAISDPHEWADPAIDGSCRPTPHLRLRVRRSDMLHQEALRIADIAMQQWAPHSDGVRALIKEAMPLLAGLPPAAAPPAAAE